MPIIELAFVIPKPELESRRQFDEKMPGVLSEQFSSLAKLHFAYSANVLEATGKDAASRDGVCLVIQWGDVSAFDAFVTSPGFGAFKSSMLPYLAGPADLQLYDSPQGDSIQMVVERSSYLHLIKIYPDTNATTALETNRDGLDEEWKTLMNIMGESSGSFQPFLISYSGLGLRSEDGVFLGVSGWQDRELLDMVLGNVQVMRQLQHLEKAGGSNLLSTFIFETKRVSLARE